MGMVYDAGQPKNLSASGIVSAIPGVLRGFYVNSTTSGIITISDSATAGGAAAGVFTGSITPAIGWNAFPAAVAIGCYITLVSGSINITAIFQPT